MPLKLTTYYHGKDIPELPGKNTFHSKELFLIYEATPGYTPLLIVATEDGRPVARLLAAIRKAKKWLPSSLVKHCVVYSEGEFLDESLSTNKEKAEEVFGDMLEHLTQEASRSCSVIGFSVPTIISQSTGCGYAIRCTVWKRQKTGSVRRVCVR